MRKAFICIYLSLFGLPILNALAQADELAALQARRDMINAVLDSLEMQRYEQNSAPATTVAAASTSSASVQAAPSTSSSSAFEEALKKDNERSSQAKRVQVHGVLRTSIGIDSEGQTIVNRANADLNERNWRMLNHDALNRGVNTFDPAIYSQAKVVVDAAVSQAVSAHLNITIDPWSYTGKTDEKHLVGSWGNDPVNIRYLTWGNSAYTLNRTANTLFTGDGINLSELKVKNGKVPATTTQGVFGPYNDVFNIPEMKVRYTFQPIREAWVDIKPTDSLKMRIFPYAYDDQALTSDDPLKISNNRTWWEESPWLRSWEGGYLAAGGTPSYFSKGFWDRSLSFYSKDSSDKYLTALRGGSIELTPDDETSIKATVATPKTLWQEYGEVTAVPAALRAKHYVGDRAYVGSTLTAHQGFVNNTKDADNYVQSVDAGIKPVDGVAMIAQASRSTSHYDQRNPDYQTKQGGGAYYAMIEATSNQSAEMLKKDYFGIQPQEKTDDFYKMRLFWGRMDEKFESSLANYKETRKDTFWSRHLTFYPSIMRYVNGVSLNFGEDDVYPFGIGNGLDYGRTAVGWRGDMHLLDGNLQGLADVRHVTNNKGDVIETVFRNEWDYKVTDRLTTKALAVRDQLPKTKEGIDPFLVSSNGGQVLNNAVIGGKDPSLFTGSLGARYQTTDWSAINGVWEYTNDSTLATDNFPRGVLGSSSFGPYTENGNFYRQSIPFVYDQGYFGQAPYDYFNIFKTGLELTPSETWHFYLDYTRNMNQFAGNIDDNMNHYGLEAAYTPTKKFGVFARYSISQGYDIEQLVNEKTLNYKSYHNVYLMARYIPVKDNTLSLEYGVGPAYNVMTQASDPKLGLYAAASLETQHLFRLVYERKF